MVKTVRVDVESYGTVTGVSDGQVDQFLGIPYASLTKRWSKATYLDRLAGDRHDGTRHGPACPQPKLAPISITQLAVPGHSANPDVAEDEFACLHLNVVRPSQFEGRLPVMVWIHGGGFSVGANSELVYDGKEIVCQSRRSDKPVIFVAINYRVGFFGFLASQDLLEETQGEYAGNYGLWDQSLALEWVQNNIEAFGGAPSRTTIYGESAGSVSVHCHLLRGKELFNQAICQSGVTNSLGPLPLDSPCHQGLYEALKKQVKVQNLHELRACTSAQLVAAMPELYPDLPALFLVDDTAMRAGFFPSQTSWTSVPNICEAMILGTCGNEGIIMAKALAATGPDRLVTSLEKSGISTQTLEAYGIAAVSAEPFPTIVPKLIEFHSDLVFNGPTGILKTKVNPLSLYAYRFERENKWRQSPFYGVSHHTIDLLYLAGIPLRYPTEEAETDGKIAVELLHAWIKFAYGEQPWSPYSQDQTELVIGKDGSFTSTKVCGHSSDRMQLMKAEFEKDPVALLNLNAALSNGAVRR